MKPAIPDKRYFKIGEVSKLAGVATHVLRYWETEFSRIQPDRANSKQRLYRYKDVETILTIKSLLHEQGYTISGARRFLAAPKTTSTCNPKTPRNEKEHLQEIKNELRKLQTLLKRQ